MWPALLRRLCVWPLQRWQPPTPSVHPSDRQSPPPAVSAQTDGENVFRRLFFAQGQVGKDLSKLELFAEARKHIDNDSPDEIRASNVVIDLITKRSPGFFADFSEKTRSGDPRQVEKAVTDAQNMLLAVAKDNNLQMALLYFQSCVAKLPHAEWADGTVLYYWVYNYAFGAPYWLRPVLDLIVDNPVGVAAMTWGPRALEIVLAAALLMPQRVRWMLLPAGMLFHLSIAIVMGLWSFAIAMWAGLLLLLSPLGHDPDFKALLRRTHRHPVAGQPGVDEPSKERVPA